MIPKNCHVMAKPSGSVCNLDCSYCFYLEKEKLYPERQKQWKMSEDVLELYIKQQIEAQDGNEVVIAWQGGEPTLMGIEFYQKAVEFERIYSNGKKIINTFQTNGVKINEQWCVFFKKYKFLVGVSLDGPAELHDQYRRSRSGKPTHAKVVRAIELLKKFGVEFNILAVVNNINVKYPLKVYQHLKAIGAEHIQFSPIIERRSLSSACHELSLISSDYSGKSRVTEWSVNPKEYADFLNTIFLYWVRKDVGRIYIQMFEQAFAAWCNQPAQMCVFAKNCGSAMALEANGDIYNCDHYVYPENKIGNIKEKTIKEMNSSDQNLLFGMKKNLGLSEECNSCTFLFACNGGCPKHRFEKSKSGEFNKNYFCDAYQSFFSCSKPYLDLMKTLWQQGIPPYQIVNVLAMKKM